jgi:hypothetical protein
MYRHRQCAWCGRLKHADGTTHGRWFSPRILARMGYSHGVCNECKARLTAGVAFF